MKIRLAFLSFIALTLFFFVKVVLGYEQSKSFLNIRNLTVLISNEGLAGAVRGTGVLLDDLHVLTCAHMVSNNGDTFFIYTYPLNKVIIAHPEAVNNVQDLAILVLESSAPIKSPPVFQEDVKEGEPITIIGNILGSMKWFVTKGVISGQERDFLLTDALAQPGDSGGPWVNEKGEIVALTDWTLKNTDGMSMGIAGGISAKTINKQLNDYKHRNDILRLLIGISS